ncbi:hypothetical protein B0H16DRAFT_1666972 [Mycena metata]|uniref:Integrase core domain-containing protein n=1 Tax=Mycena metata TaxID=1033252 RepID=A0AAD7HAM6_9AGAR|nr:hypothetical protein B0H16DRAFT_1666972 [Mycena metata]
METHRGPGRGSYIWGRSVHNTRIERLWYDVTHGFGQKWKNFFHDLELNHGLNPRRTGNIWLLHHLFLQAINEDALEWAQAWNSHNPRNMFAFSMVQDGPRGILHMAHPVDEPGDDPASYGVDWPDWENENPFHVPPAQLSHVPCEPPNYPFTPEQVALLDQTLREQVDLTSRNMVICRLVWQEALNICNFFSQQSA